MMISFERARRLVLSATRPLGAERVPLEEADGRVLAGAIRARMDMPRFDQSAMDGFAVKLEDVAGASPDSPAELILDGDIPAGTSKRARLGRGHTMMVFTGSTLPAGTEAVVMREYGRQRGDLVLLERDASPRENMRRRGEEFKKGDPLLDRGTRIDPSVVGLLANFGYTDVRVYARPRVTLLTLGDELVPLGGRLKAGKIYNSNQFSLRAALERIGVRRIRAKTLPDDPAVVRREMSRGLRESDVLLAAGGASVGDYDFVRPVAEELGIDERFRAIAVKPGKPVFFGTWRPPGKRGPVRVFFGVPGNPVSAMVSLHEFVRPALLKMMGLPEPHDLSVVAELSEECRKKPGRLHLLRGRLQVVDGRLLVHPSERQGSHMMGGMATADCLIFFPRGSTLLKKGDRVRVKLISW